MSIANLDRAYCHETDSILTIYQVRELHFDETVNFQADKATYECPDRNCNVEITGVNHTKTKFKVSPHFRLLPKHEHNEDCSFYSVKKPAGKSDHKGKQKSSKPVIKHPEVLLLDKQPIPHNTGKTEILDISGFEGKKDTKNKSRLASSDKQKYTTSSLEHVVETWLTHSEEELKYSLLTIGDTTKWYRNIFKEIKYFTDGEGLIYWGYLKEIKAYGKGYAFKFIDKPWFKGEERYISIYVSAKQIDKYRKKTLFRSYIDSLIDRDDIKVRCFFVGAYPKLTKIKHKGRDFFPLKVEINNLDHLLLRFDEDENI